MALFKSAISSHPRTEFLSNFLAVQSSEDTLAILEFAVRNEANQQSTLFLIEEHLRKSYFSIENLESAVTDFSELFGDKNAIKIFEFLLGSTDQDLAIAAATSILKNEGTTEVPPDLMALSISKLWQLAEGGVADALEALIFYSDLKFDSPDLKRRLLLAGKQIPENDLRHYTANRLLSTLKRMPTDDLDAEYAKYLYEKSISSSPLDLFGPRVLVEFGAPIDLRKLVPETDKANTAFEECISNFSVIVFSCLKELEGLSKDDLFEPLMSLMDIQLLIDVYPLKSKEDIAETLISEVFSTKIPITVKDEFVGLLLPYKSGEHNELPSETVLELAFIFDRIDKFMWDNFPAEIVTTPDIENFSMLSSQQWKSFGEYFERIHDGQSTYQRILYEQSSIEQALKFLPMAKNQNFFKEFNSGVFFLFSKICKRD